MNPKSRRRAWPAMAAAAAFTATSASAHHSFAAYDQAVTMVQSGTLKEFVLSAPHSGITVAGRDKSGATQTVSVTTGAPGTISRQGFTPADFRVGSTVKLSWHPNRNGMPGGEMVDLVLEDGRVLQGGFGAPPDAAKAPSTASGATH